MAESEFLRALAEREGTPVLTELPREYLEPVTDAIPAAFMEELLLVPYQRTDTEGVRIAAAQEVDPATRRELREVLGGPAEIVAAPKALVLELIKLLYGGAGSQAAGRLSAEPEDESGVTVDEDIEQLANQPPVIRLVNFLIQEAARKVRYRIDGVLHDITKPPKKYQAAVISRIKLLAELDITERRRPQDGRIRMRLDGHAIDLRISTVPTLHGESVVMRVLDRESIRLPLEGLGFPADSFARFQEVLGAPHGIILVSGPTGSGKTTTLYAALEKLNRPDVKIFTVEDPVEYQLSGVNQMPVRPLIGVTFASALRSILRQDPDILMVGEMRDFETAEIAIQAALTGHLVFSTLHTNDAPGGVVRLLEMGVEAYLVCSTVVAILAQRLVRTVCRDCVAPVPGPLPEAALVLLGDAGAGSPGLVRGRGCARCGGTGYRGRTGIYELLVVDEEIKKVIAPRTSADRVRQVALACGMRSLRADGLRKVLDGVTTLEEVLRVTEADGGAT